MTYNDSTIGGRIRLARHRMGLNQTAFGELIGLEQHTVSDLELDQRVPTADEALRIAQATGRTVGWLLGEPEQQARRPLRQRLNEFLDETPLEVPIYDQEVHAGLEGAFVLDYSYWSPPRVAGRNIAGVKVRGTCLEPEIRPGDVVFIDREKTVRPGNLAVVLTGDGLHVTRAVQRKGSLWFVNTDGEYPADGVKIEGVVIQMSRDLG